MARKKFQRGKKYKTLPKCKFYVMTKRVNGVGINIKCANKLPLAECLANNSVLSRDRQMYPSRSPTYVTPFRPKINKNVNIYDDYDNRHEYCSFTNLFKNSTALSNLKKYYKWGNKYHITRKNNKISFKTMRKSQ